MPGDAYKMDFVFADVESGDGTYDNRGGYDYHLPVSGSPVRVPLVNRGRKGGGGDGAAVGCEAAEGGTTWRGAWARGGRERGRGTAM